MSEGEPSENYSSSVYGSQSWGESLDYNFQDNCKHHSFNPREL